MKAIKGNDAFYVVQKAFSRTPSAEESEECIHYLQQVMVCDTRLNTCDKTPIVPPK